MEITNKYIYFSNAGYPFGDTSEFRMDIQSGMLCRKNEFNGWAFIPSTLLPKEKQDELNTIRKRIFKLQKYQSGIN